MFEYIQDLFGIQSMNGIIPKLNELYLFIEETTNTINRLRDILGLGIKGLNLYEFDIVFL